MITRKKPVNFGCYLSDGVELPRGGMQFYDALLGRIQRVVCVGRGVVMCNHLNRVNTDFTLIECKPRLTSPRGECQKHLVLAIHLQGDCRFAFTCLKEKRH